MEKDIQVKPAVSPLTSQVDVLIWCHIRHILCAGDMQMYQTITYVYLYLHQPPADVTLNDNTKTMLDILDSGNT